MSKNHIIEAIVSFPALDAPRAANETSKPKYGLTAVITKEYQQSAAWKDLLETVKDVAIEAWGPKKGPTMVTIGGKHSTFRNDGADKGYPEGAVTLGARSDNPVGLVYPWPSEPGSKKPALVPADKIKETFYAGARVRISIRPYASVRADNPGVRFGLQNVQWLGHGERLDGRRAAQEEFEADLSMTPESLDDVAAAQEMLK